MNLTVAEIASKLGLPFEGDGTAVVRGLASVREAEAGEISFIANPRYAADAAATRATVLLVSKDWNKPSSAAALIRVDDPDKAFALVGQWFAPPPPAWPVGVHPTAVVAPDAQIGRDVVIGPQCVIEPGVVIGDRSVLVAQCYLGHGVTIGCDTKLYPQVSLRERVQIGDRCILHNGTVVGSDGFGYSVDARGVRTKIPQLGIVVIGNDVEIGANVTIDRARFGKTRIGNGVKIDNLVQIAHNVVIGEHAVLVAQVGVAGSAEIGHHAIIAGQVGVAGHIVVGPGAVIGAQAGVHKDVPARAMLIGSPAVPREEFARMTVHWTKLGDMKQRIIALEKRLEALTPKSTSP
ncbi:MAG: UDP-3-O-(3-hydroxymyristoyl)glucosamine N-acyltransferase [Verrucomicrobia bacterium]|nr:MAG: UDP-3-O-(3-hydroxymyristoyl)glucosamine N-acyltransferase [Verrucomicrobiota bacterium]